MRVLIDGRAIGEIGDRDEIVGTDRAQELAHVGAAAQAAIARAAVRRAGHADAVADLHAPHVGPDGFDDADLADGTPVYQNSHIGGLAELMVTFEEWVVPIFTTSPAADVGMACSCVAVAGLGATARMR